MLKNARRTAKWKKGTKLPAPVRSATAKDIWAAENAAGLGEVRDREMAAYWAAHKKDLEALAWKMDSWYDHNRLAFWCAITVPRWKKVPAAKVAEYQLAADRDNVSLSQKKRQHTVGYAAATISYNAVH